jgi:AraC family transcriptional regulator of adaptative response/methylated-DNA-[protein]-cysteine methyltransferase
MSAKPPSDDACWAAVQARDARLDGRFVFAVATTGVFCHPSCRSRQPLRKNVRFFATAALARAAGFRACQRCRPETPRTARPSDDRAPQWCAWIRQRVADGEPVRLDDLANEFGLSPTHLQRIFQAAVGVSPRRYAEAVRQELFRGRLREAPTVTDAIYDAGFSSSSRAYEKQPLGMTPRAYRAGGRDQDVAFAILDLPELRDLGRVLVAATDRGVCAVMLGGTDAQLRAQLQDELPAARLVPVVAPFSRQLSGWIAALRQHLRGAGTMDLPLDVRGTALRLRVWSYLRTIPRGEVRTYAQVAAAVGHPRAVRAVASACANNPVAVVVPCHRVLRADGGMGGYRWGLARKRKLLAAEASTRS